MTACLAEYMPKTPARKQEKSIRYEKFRVVVPWPGALWTRTKLADPQLLVLLREPSYPLWLTRMPNHEGCNGDCN